MEVDAPVAFPIIHWHRLADGRYSIDPGDQGSAFFISMGPVGGVFLTAKHVVETQSSDKPYYLLILDSIDEPKSFYSARVQGVELHPDYDAAVGLVRLIKPVKCLSVGRRQLQPGEPFVTFGYPNTQLVEFYNDEQERCLGINYAPAQVNGFVADYQDNERRFGPVYIHETRLACGISGGPLICATDGLVYALNSLGYPPDCELALAIAPLLDWRVKLLDGMTLGEFLTLHERTAGVTPAGTE
ncbi:trypsin-like peptidase domain-containing protein [Sorangium sp. So ce887]|uniref:trypsin-like peptidase domain-containing protein n=1 Tax=Sorangium sp. So ce887 TaxID=3133324 RepID=UPI003F6263CC